jgi:outer membrane protein TolC
MPNRFCFSLIISLIISLYVSAQESGSFTLQQAIEYAYQHQATVINAGIDEKIADAKVKEIIGMGLPQLSASFDVKDFEKIPTQFIPDFLSPAVYHILKDENLVQTEPANNNAVFPVQFGTRWNATAGLTASQLIFQPSYLVGVQASKTYREISRKNLTRTKVETAVAVSKAYYSTLVSRERFKLLEANVVRLQKLKDDTKALYDNGFVEKIDYDRVVLAFNNVSTEKENVSRLLVLSDNLLKLQMGMDIGSSISLTDSLSSDAVKNISVSAEKPDATKRIEYSMLETQKRVNTLELKNNRMGYVPSLIAYGSLSTSAQRDEFDIFSSGKKWYPTGLIGATLSWNLFDGFQRERKIEQAKLNIQKTENQMLNASNAFSLEAEAARTQLMNALASFNTQKENLELANEVVRVSKIKYDQGVGSNLEVINSETSLREAQTNYYNALYDALINKVDYDRAMGAIK